MTTRIFTFFCFLVLILGASGCSKQNTSADVKPIEDAIVDIPDNEPEKSKGDLIDFKITLDPRITAGDKEGLFLGEFFEVKDTSSGKDITSFTIGAPKFGTIKTYGSGHSRYYPPDQPCEDSVEIALRAEDGSEHKEKLPIHVVAKSTDQEKPKSKVAFKITSPSHLEGIEGRICDITGTAPEKLEGKRLTFYVESKWGQVYEQDDYPVVHDGKFNSWVYLGDEFGNGIGERFKIWASTDSKTNCPAVTVIRKS